MDSHSPTLEELNAGTSSDTSGVIPPGSQAALDAKAAADRKIADESARAASDPSLTPAQKATANAKAAADRRTAEDSARTAGHGKTPGAHSAAANQAALDSKAAADRKTADASAAAAKMSGLTPAQKAAADNKAAADRRTADESSAAALAGARAAGASEIEIAEKKALNTPEGQLGAAVEALAEKLRKSIPPDQRIKLAKILQSPGDRGVADQARRIRAIVDLV